MPCSAVQENLKDSPHVLSGEEEDEEEDEGEEEEEEEEAKPVVKKAKKEEASSLWVCTFAGKAPSFWGGRLANDVAMKLTLGRRRRRKRRRRRRRARSPRRRATPPQARRAKWTRTSVSRENLPYALCGAHAHVTRMAPRSDGVGSRCHRPEEHHRHLWPPSPRLRHRGRNKGNLCVFVRESCLFRDDASFELGLFCAHTWQQKNYKLVAGEDDDDDDDDE